MRISGIPVLCLGLNLGLGMSLILAAGIASAETPDAGQNIPQIEEIVVWGEAAQRASSTHPSTVITPEDLVGINVQTTEDVVKYEPGLVVRRRFIGDSNGTLGMRGSNMFQTSRSMVFADGVPLHYLLQSRWNGSPRWSMIAASEIAQVDVLYGPFSAEYSGNSMGGVILIESAIPQEREVHFDMSLFSQQFSAYGFDQVLNGNRSFFSYGDKVGDLSLYFSVNRLENESQPQSFYYAAAGSGAATSVDGAIAGNDEKGRPQLWFGDSGSIDTRAYSYKFKAAYDLGAWSSLLNIAYEDRNDAGAPNTYLRDTAGNAFWGGAAEQQGQALAIPAERFGVSLQQRDSLSVGLRIKGSLTDAVELESNLNQFSILRDHTYTTLRNPADPAYTNASQTTDFGDTGWTAAEIKLNITPLLHDDMLLVTGLRHEAYELNIDVLDSAAGIDQYGARSGGKTALDAFFAQLQWDINASWDVTLGARYEMFEGSGGYYSDDDPATALFDLVPVPGQERDAVSPKFSVGYQPSDLWSLRYSAARAYRFPIVEELFSQYEAYNSVNQANPELFPERGLHQNLTVERQIGNGYLRLNLFHETVDDVIEAQSVSVPGGLSVRTFIPLDEVVTSGAEAIYNAYNLFDRLDVRFNVTYTDAEITRNRVRPALEGNRYPRMPNWRSNLLLTWHFSDAWNASVNYQFADSSFGQLDNSDTQKHVFGAQDGYSRVGIKSNYQFGNGISLGLGVDNLSNDIAYVSHPWPGRTWYLDFSWSM